MPFDPDFSLANKPVIRSEFAGDPDMQEIIDLFVQEMPLRICELQDSWSGKQFDKIKRVAHQLKGACGGYGFSQVGAAAGQLEQSVKSLAATPEDNLLEGIRKQLDSLIDMCGRVSSK